MNSKYEQMWELAVPYLKQGRMKDFVVHTEGVVKAMEMILAGEGGDEDIFIPAAILHDVGFAKVDPALQTNGDLEKKREAQRQHLIFAQEIIEEILERAGYSAADTQKVVAIVEAHKFQDPVEKDKQLLIDADNLSDTFKEQFETDMRAYGVTPQELFCFRQENQYYTTTARQIAEREMVERKHEIT